MTRQPNTDNPATTHPVVADELAQLERVQEHLRSLKPREGSQTNLAFDDELIELRDEVIEAKEEDVAPLAEQMMRVAAIRAARGAGGSADIPVDPTSPYFGHLRLEEDQRTREIFIGKNSYINASEGVVIVDWRNAPISAIYYRYEEGDDYDERIAGRHREGLVTARRTLSVRDGHLQRVRAPQGIFVRREDGGYQQLEDAAARLRGGQGVALRPKGPVFVSRRKRDKRQANQLGERGRPGLRPDKHLPEISALLDAEQFGLITSEKGGLMIVTGGAGSGKTTIGLHRIAFLAFARPRYYRPERMLVVVPGEALAAYVGRVLPDLGLPGIPVRTTAAWLLGQRRRMFSRLRAKTREEESGAARLVKKHPRLPKLLDDLAAEDFERVCGELREAVAHRPGGDTVLDATTRLREGPLALRLEGLLKWCRGDASGGTGPRLAAETLAAVESVLRRFKVTWRLVVRRWAELLTNRERLNALVGAGGPSPGQISEAVLECSHQADILVEALDAQDHGERRGGRGRKGRRKGRGEEGGRFLAASIVDEADSRRQRQRAWLSPEDDAILLALYQRYLGPLIRKSGRPLEYAHLLVDEVQDLSVVELSVLLGCAPREAAVTLAGDPAQRMVFDTGYGDWPELLDALGLEGVKVAPLRIGYRSTAEIQRFAQSVLGPAWQDGTPAASREGVPVEAFSFGNQGEAVAFLADALRELASNEPLASVALITRYPAQADLYFDALRQADVGGLRRVVGQEFSFAPGIEVTEVRQVKGLEFDYVVLLDVTAETYGDSPEARHLLHIGATRAAHQLWLVVPGRPSPLLGDSLG